MITKLRNRRLGIYRSRSLDRRAYHKLSGLDDHMLMDIGLSRLDLADFKYSHERYFGPEPR